MKVQEPPLASPLSLIKSGIAREIKQRYPKARFLFFEPPDVDEALRVGVEVEGRQHWTLFTEELIRHERPDLCVKLGVERIIGLIEK